MSESKAPALTSISDPRLSKTEEPHTGQKCRKPYCAVSPVTATTDDFRVNLGYRILDSDGTILQCGMSIRSIPVIVIPGDQQYLSFDISAAEVPKAAAVIEIEMVQGEDDWWGRPLRFPIPQR